MAHTKTTGAARILGKSEAATLRTEAIKALTAIAEHHGFELHALAGQYSPNEWFRIQFEFALPGASAEATAWRSHAYIHGPEVVNALGRTYPYQDHRYTVAGWKTRARRMPVIMIREDGARFKWSVELLKSVLRAVHENAAGGGSERPSERAMRKSVGRKEAGR